MNDFINHMLKSIFIMFWAFVLITLFAITIAWPAVVGEDHWTVWLWPIVAGVTYGLATITITWMEENE